ncbi:hypothetical protein PFISCL1PPCAC_24134 [Pristionchus fissidentatus]|uniref:WD repeat-containing protein 44 n=1 Tax=Pristionchus fissidentatus TaxID=1538716 RepID=A0AAV5WP85_9BILA|nr:hypothetical protein PFISCL1PPCAC_24134 [Pristionchus fissidentatus]
MSTEEEDEFEDALDCLPGLPTEMDLTSPHYPPRLDLSSPPPSLPLSTPLHPSTPMTSSTVPSSSLTAGHHPPPLPSLPPHPCSITPTMPPPPPISPRRPESIVGLTTPLTSTAAPVDPSMSARQERLANLRRRLRDEFGHSSRGRAPSSNCDAADSISLTSDSTSLHSWHHSLLGGNSCPVVRAADSMSTCAGSNYGQFSPSPSSPPPSAPPPRLSSSHPPPLPPRPASIRLPDPVAIEVLARIAEAERIKNAAMNGAPDVDIEEADRSRDIEETLVMRDERTLMATSHCSSSGHDVFSSPSTSFNSPLTTSSTISPRLRPRSKSTREQQEEEEDAPRERKTSDRVHNTSSESVQQQQQQSSTNSSAATISESKPHIPLLHPVSSERRRGHTKTNSLDRGLTLAKSIKTGPFPPPSSKSNSLTRGQNGPNFEGEEEERNCLADQVIQQLTTSVIGEGAIVVDDHEKRRPSQLGAIPSCSSSSPSSSASSVSSSRGDKRGGKGRKEEERNGRRKDEGRRKKDALSVVKESPEHAVTPPLDTTQDDSDEETAKRGGWAMVSPPRDTVSPSRPPPPGGTVGSCRSLPLQDRTLGSRLGEWAGVDDKHSADTSYDPITRDVERRMSMKGHGQMGGVDGGIRGDDDEADSASIAGSTLSSAGTAVKEMASGLFRGVLSRARSALHAGTSSSSKAAPESELSDSESDGDEPSLADSASMAGRQSAASSTNSSSVVRPRNAKKGPFDFAELKVVQEITNEHTGAVWCVKFSICGRLMATAGHDTIIRVWCVRSALRYFNDMREKYQQKRGSTASSTNNSFDGFDRTMADLESDLASSYKPASSDAGDSLDGGSSEDGETSLFATKPFAVFKGHTSDVLDLSWSKNYFVLSSGMDRTVKLWHLSRSECLCCFQHVDFVTCVSFLPKDDRYFLSGSLDGKLRMWHIPDKKVAVWNEVGVKFITALAFAKSGKFAVVGTYNGKCYFYSTDQLKYHTVVDVRSTRGKNARGHKVTGLAVHGDKLLVTSNDSRIRMYDVRDKALTCKFKGAQNERSQIRAHFSPDGKHIVCGSEDRYVYIWRTSDLPSSLSVRKDRNAQWERVRTHTVPVSVATFAPKPALFLTMMQRAENAKRRGPNEASYRGSAAAWAADAAAAASPPAGDVIISADLSGCIKIMVNRAKPVKLGQSTFFQSSSG